MLFNIIILAVSNFCPQAEELIKSEMMTMLHYDSVYSPVPIVEPKRRGQVMSQAQHLAYLEQHPYINYGQDQITQVKNWLSDF